MSNLLESTETEMVHAELLKIIEREHGDLANSLSNVQSDLSKTVDRNRDNVALIKSVQSTCSSLADRSSVLAAESSQLRAAISDSRRLIEETDAKLAQIRQVVGLIEDISDQTKLLALNATIEAARAGEAGHGFAVVAHEVKELSTETQRAVGQIRASVQEVVISSKLSTERLSEIENQASAMGKSISAYVSELNESNQKNELVATGAELGNDQLFLSLAKLDHILWKVNTYGSVVEGKAKFPFVDSDNCRLGKWYRTGEGQARFSQSPGYRELEQPHARVHNATQEIFSILESPMAHERTQELALAIETMESASRSVFDLLDRMLSHR